MTTTTRMTATMMMMRRRTRRRGRTPLDQLIAPALMSSFSVRVN
jgi:hypothetical protein